MIWSIAFAPVLPVPVLAAAGLSALAVLALMAFRRRPGVVLRALALALLLLGAARPELVAEDRKALPAVVALVADRSASQSLAGRPVDTDTAYAALKERLAHLPGIEVREVPAAATDNADGTRLFADIARALSDVPVERIGGVAVVTDGRIHDAPKDIVGLGFSAPVHVLVTGDPGEYDRRVQLTSSPKFALVRSTQRLSFRLVDDGQSPDGAPVPVVVRRDGETIATVTMAPGEERSVDIAIPHAGDNIVEVEAPPLSGEISRLNNTEVAVIDGVRQALRVLLVSGEPHAGERTWRNLLKSDANVDLVHFTILRPPEKQDGTPINELSLIAFPTRELFQQKIKEFDLIIFDRYANQSVLPSTYFDNISLKGAVNKAKFSYNSGQMIQAGALLHRITGKKRYLAEAQQTAAACLTHFFRPVHKPGGGSVRILRRDKIWFDAVMLRGFIELSREDGRQTGLDAFRQTLDHAWTCSRDCRGLLADWSGRGREGRKWLLSQAALAEMFARMADVAE